MPAHRTDTTRQTEAPGVPPPVGPPDPPAPERRRPSPREPERSRSIEVKTLVIAAAAAVVAAVVTSTFWQKGALISTALTPVIVTLVQEALRRPAEKISATAARVTPAPGAGALAAIGRRRREAGDGPPAAQPAGDERPRPAAANGGGPDRAPRPTVYRRKPFRLRLALLTALAAFVIAVGVLTIPEMVFGGSLASDRGTTLFGGDRAAESSGDPDGGDTGSEEAEEEAPADGAESQAAPEEGGSEPLPPEEETTEETAPLPEEEAPVPPPE